MIPYSGKLSREKTFANFEILWLFVKVFSAKFGCMASLAAQASNLRKFSCEIFYQFAKVSRYTVLQWSSSNVNTVEITTASPEYRDVHISEASGIFPADGGNVYLCCWALWRHVPKLSLAVCYTWQKRLTRFCVYQCYYNVQLVNCSAVVENLVCEACKCPHYPAKFVQSRY